MKIEVSDIPAIPAGIGECRFAYRVPTAGEWYLSPGVGEWQVCDTAPRTNKRIVIVPVVKKKLSWVCHGNEWTAGDYKITVDAGGKFCCTRGSMLIDSGGILMLELAKLACQQDYDHRQKRSPWTLTIGEEKIDFAKLFGPFRTGGQRPACDIGEPPSAKVEAPADASLTWGFSAGTWTAFRTLLHHVAVNENGQFIATSKGGNGGSLTCIVSSLQAAKEECQRWEAMEAKSQQKEMRRLPVASVGSALFITADWQSTGMEWIFAGEGYRFVSPATDKPQPGIEFWNDVRRVWQRRMFEEHPLSPDNVYRIKESPCPTTA